MDYNGSGPWVAAAMEAAAAAEAAAEAAERAAEAKRLAGPD